MLSLHRLTFQRQARAAGEHELVWLDKRGQNYRLVFQVGGQTFKRSLGTSDRREAEGLVALVERRIKMVGKGELTVPEDIDLPTFLVTDGKAKKTPTVKAALTLAVTIERYLASIPAGSLEENTLDTLRIHLRHLRRLLGDNFRLDKLSFHDLQRNVEVRSREGGRRSPYDHDFPSFAEGKVIPYGIHDLAANQAHATIGTSHDTSEFAGECLALWWEQHGRERYPTATKLLLLCDGGGNNASNRHVFKEALQHLADRLGIEIRVAH